MSHILIVGGGIGGMAAAISLSRGGHQVELIEREAGWRALGAGLTLNGASMRVLDHLGMLDLVLEHGYGAPGTGRAYRADGTLFTDTNPAKTFGERIPVMGGIMRPVLHELFKSVVHECGINARPGITFTTMEQDPDQVRVGFSDGSSGSYDLVIAADGLFSQVRQTIFPELPRPAFTGQGCWRAVVPRPADQALPAMYFNQHTKAGFNPVSKTQMYMYVLVPVPGNPHMPPEQWPQLLRAAIADFGGQIAELRAQISEDSQINYRPLEGILVEEPWHKGRILLIGDACHATTPHIGYGAGLAMEDGWVIADELRKNPDYKAAFPAFQARRFERCAAVVRGSKRLGEMELAGGPPEENGKLFKSLIDLIRAEI